MTRRVPLAANGRPAHCHWCARQLEPPRSRSNTRATQDHVVPQSDNGRLTVWACWTCNQIKGAMDPIAWALFMQRNPFWWRLPPRPAVQTVAAPRIGLNP